MDTFPMLMMQLKMHKHGAVCENKDGICLPTSSLSQIVNPISIQRDEHF